MLTPNRVLHFVWGKYYRNVPPTCTVGCTLGVIILLKMCCNLLAEASKFRLKISRNLEALSCNIIITDFLDQAPKSFFFQSNIQNYPKRLILI